MIQNAAKFISSSRHRLMRSVLFSPGHKINVLQKGRAIPSDVLVFDLEDAVAPSSKILARQNIVSVLAEGGFGRKTLVVRINGLDTQWGQEDLAAVACLENLDAIMIPKVESPTVLRELSEFLDVLPQPKVSLWPQIETPMGVIKVEEIAGCGLERVSCLVMGTSDLTADLRAQHTATRHPMLYSLSKCIVAARAFGLQILDGVQLKMDNDEEFLQVCQQGKELGFDGKTLIHPKTVELANRIFGPSKLEVDRAQQIISCFNDANQKGIGIAVFEGKLIENLHVKEAQRVIELFETIEILHGKSKL